jgi:hypothetical protein
LKIRQAVEDGKPVLQDDATVLDWNRDHPMLRHLSLKSIYAQSMMKLETASDDEVLIDGVKGPMLVLHREGRSTHLVCAFNVLDSNWPLKLSFPVFLYNALQFMAVSTDLNVRQSFPPGATPRIARGNLQRIGEPKRIQLSGAMGSREITVPDSGDFVLPALDQVGVYSTSPVIPGFERFAVNLLDASESNLIPADAPPGGVGEAVANTAGKSRLELWWWIVACAALPLLFIEWWVYTRRVHL